MAVSSVVILGLILNQRCSLIRGIRQSQRLRAVLSSSAYSASSTGDFNARAASNISHCLCKNQRSAIIPAANFRYSINSLTIVRCSLDNWCIIKQASSSMNSVASLNTIGFKFFSFCSKLDYTYCTFLSQRLLYFWFAAVFSIFASAILLTYPLIRLKPACRACPMIVPIREIVLPSCDDSPTLAFIKVLIFESLLFCCKT